MSDPGHGESTRTRSSMLSVLPFADQAHQRIGWETVNSGERGSICRQSAQTTESAEETVNVTSSRDDTSI